MGSLTEFILGKAGFAYGSDRLETMSEQELPDILTSHHKSVCKIQTVQRVYRRFLLAAFLLRKKEYQVKHDGNVRTKVLLHHTDPCNVTSILRTNLDWRKVTRAKYGKGVSFTDDPVYGHTHSNGYLSSQTIVVAEILMKNTSCNYYSKSIDTTVSSNGCVYVKYRDDEFLPKFVIHYNGPEKHRKWHDSW